MPDGVGNAEAEAILPHVFSERLRPPEPDGSWRDWTILQFSDFFRMRLMAERAGLWLDADVLLLKPVEIDPTKPYFAWERPRQLGNSVLYLPPDDAIVAAFEGLMEQEELTPDWLALRHRLTFMMRQLRGGSNRLSDIRIAIYGPASLTALARRSGELQYALPKQSFYAVHAEPKLFFEPIGFFEAARRPRYHRAAYLAKRPRPSASGSRQPVCLGGEAVWQLDAARPSHRPITTRAELFDLAQRQFAPLSAHMGHTLSRPEVFHDHPRQALSCRRVPYRCLWRLVEPSAGTE